MLSPHPIVLDGFQLVLSRGGLRSKAIRVHSLHVSDIRLLKIPACQAYVVDDPAPNPLLDALVANLAARFEKVPIVLATGDAGDEHCFPFLRMGVRGVVPYPQIARQLARAVKAVCKGGFWIPREMLTRFVDSLLSQIAIRSRAVDAPDMSRREKEVYSGLMENRSNKEIAGQLHISERTVKFHVSNLLGKFRVRRRADLILLSTQVAPHVM